MIPKLAGLPFMMPLGSTSDKAWWVAHARETDVCLLLDQKAAGGADSNKFNLMPSITRGRMAAIWKDYNAMQPGGLAPLTPALVPGLAVLGYNPETGAQTPSAQLLALPTYCQLVKAMAVGAGVRCLIAPDRENLQKWAPQIAPFCDDVIIQIQKLGGDPQQAYDYVIRWGGVLRRANPNVRVWAQVGATTDALTEMKEALEAVAKYVDGWAFWESAPTFDVMTTLLAMIRGDS